MLRSSCLVRMSPPKHTLFTFRIKVHTVRLSFLATRYNFQAHASWLTHRLSKETKLYENFTYGPHAARGYQRVKLQRWEYTERRTPENIWKIPILLTIVWGSLTLAPIICRTSFRKSRWHSFNPKHCARRVLYVPVRTEYWKESLLGDCRTLWGEHMQLKVWNESVDDSTCQWRILIVKKKQSPLVLLHRAAVNPRKDMQYPVCQICCRR